MHKTSEDSREWVQIDVNEFWVPQIETNTHPFYFHKRMPEKLSLSLKHLVFGMCPSVTEAAIVLLLPSQESNSTEQHFRNYRTN